MHALFLIRNMIQNIVNTKRNINRRAGDHDRRDCGGI